MKTGSGYVAIQSTRPQTLAYGLNDSPAGLLSWIAEKFHAWTDNNGSVEDAISRDALLTNVALYGQDTITHGRVTMQLGVRYDYNHDQALASAVTANPLMPDILPAVTFAGTDPGVKFNNFSPRLGLTYDLTGRQDMIVLQPPAFQVFVPA